MVQRLASKGFLEYLPYKGSILTEQGLIHGKKMKRRHRLAEVLLEHLPFTGNQHATACRLEHAIDDDLEVALTIYLNNPQTDPSGTSIPTMSKDIESRVNSSIGGFRTIRELETGESSAIRIIAAGPNDLQYLDELNISVGAEITLTETGDYQIGDTLIQLDDELASRIII
tara:strand:- start:909 stop:1421 length:513 start_codon:yes stop_codon:yes gene_type:complete